jgi:hypothetical protein
MRRAFPILLVIRKFRRTLPNLLIIRKFKRAYPLLGSLFLI